jgi:hypothetical protein
MYAPEDSRLFNLSQGNPRTLVLEALYAFETADEARHAEKEVKRAFLAFLVRGEWFRVAWEDVHAWFMRAYPEMYPTA